MEEKTPVALTAEFPLENLSLAQERVAALNKRAAKLGVAPLVLTVSAPFPKEIRVLVNEGEAELDLKPKYETVLVPFVTAELTGEGPKVVGGWALAAALERVEDLGTVVRTVPGKAVAAKWRTEPSFCDHCKTLRARKVTYVLQNAAGEETQVGSDCLKDFLGHSLNSVFCFWTELDGAFGDLCGGGGTGGDFYWLENFLTYVSAVVRRHGWVSRTVAREFGKSASADDADSWLRALAKGDRKSGWLDEAPPSDADAARAKGAIDWARTVLAEKVERSDYEHNLFLVMSRDTVDVKHLGIAASAIQAYERHLGREIERKKKFESEKASAWQGEVKKRQVWKDLTLVFSKEFESQFGVKTLLKFRDPSGNVFVWWASGEISLEIGDCLDLKATVKAHDEYEGVKQTVLTRGDWKEVKSPAAESSAESAA